MVYIGKAVNEQLRSLIGPEKVTNEKRKGKLTVHQITGFRRSFETIVIRMIDQEEMYLKSVYKKSPKKRSRKRKRGPKVLALCN